MFKLEPKEIPKSSILECVKSKSKPRLNLSLGKRKIDLRISTLPSYDSERIVLRLLDQKNQKLQLDDLGMLAH